MIVACVDVLMNKIRIYRSIKRLGMEGISHLEERTVGEMGTT